MGRACAIADLPANPRGVGRIFNSPIAGFAPFIIMSLFSAPSSFFYAAGLAVLTAIVIVVVNWRMNHIPAGQLDWAALILFGGMLIAGTIDDRAHKWLMENANLMSDIAVLVIALGGMAIGRPFALMYARLSPKFEAEWEKETPGFREWGLRGCQHISLFWVLAFLVQLGCQLLTQFGSSSFDTVLWNWIIPIGALVWAMHRTRAYSAKLRGEASEFGAQPTAS
ncbi:MAG: hypothetical protein ACO3CR_05580 [Solirubrobacterales bacterium]